MNEWHSAVPAFSSGICAEILLRVAERRKAETVYPPPESVFRALELTRLQTLKVVILGQDPYHGPDQAHGLAFSVPDHTPAPPSLKNILREVDADIGPDHGAARTANLSRWASQGVLLLNSALTVAAGRPGSHAKLGWPTLTDDIIRSISAQKEHVVFMLWGRHAQTKFALINEASHCVLQAPHPSPLSAYRGFFGCRHFSAANAYLADRSIKPIVW